MVQVLWLRLLQVMGVSAPPSPWLPPAEPAASLVSPDLLEPTLGVLVAREEGGTPPAPPL